MTLPADLPESFFEDVLDLYNALADAGIYDADTKSAAVTDAHHKAGVASITGHDTVHTGLEGTVTSVVCGMATSDTDAGTGFSCSAAPGETAGDISIVVRDATGTTEATDPATVYWFASDAVLA